MSSASASLPGGQLPQMVFCRIVRRTCIGIAAPLTDSLSCISQKSCLRRQLRRLHGLGVTCAAGAVAFRGFKGNRKTQIRRVFMSLGPAPSWDHTGGVAVQQAKGTSFSYVERGKLNQVVWMCWTGHNPIPSHLQLCLKTIERNAGLPVILVTPSNVLHYIPSVHPAYEFLHLQHRADYLRCCLLHQYGGIYLDMDTICLRDLSGLFDLLGQYDAVGYDGSEWGELIGISDMGPFKPFTEITEAWYNTLHAKLDERFDVLRQQQVYGFYWQEILRDIFVPASIMHASKVSKGLQAHNPQQDALWSTQAASIVIGSELERCHILILNNSKYGAELASLSEDQILGGPAVLSQILRDALGMSLPDQQGANISVPSSDSVPKHFAAQFSHQEICGLQTFWQLPRDSKPKAVLFLAHGMNHGAEDFFEQDGFKGLPEEHQIVTSALSRGFLVVAISSKDRVRKAWLPESDGAIVAEILKYVMQLESPDSELPIFALGASNGGMFALFLPYWVQLSGVICIVAALPGDTIQRIRNVPPVFFIHMQRDVSTAGNVSNNVRQLQEMGTMAFEYACGPIPISPSFFSERCSIPESDSAEMARALQIAGFLDSEGFLMEDPRTSGWRSVLQPFSALLGDSLVADRSPIAEVLNVAWGHHEITAEGIEEALSFCEASFQFN